VLTLGVYFLTIDLIYDRANYYHHGNKLKWGWKGIRVTIGRMRWSVNT